MTDLEKTAGTEEANDENTPVRKIGEEYCRSKNYFNRVCRDLGVPTWDNLGHFEKGRKPRGYETYVE